MHCAAAWINSLFTSSGPQLGQFESGVVAAWIGTKLSALTVGLATLAIVGMAIARCSRKCAGFEFNGQKRIE